MILAALLCFFSGLLYILPASDSLTSSLDIMGVQYIEQLKRRCLDIFEKLNVSEKRTDLI